MRYFLFFPDLGRWLVFLKKGTVIYILLSILSLSVLINCFSIKEYFSIKPNSDKYRIMKAYSSVNNNSKWYIDNFINQADTAYKNNYEKLMDFTKTYEDSVYSENERKRQIKLHRQKLKELTK